MSKSPDKSKEAVETVERGEPTVSPELQNISLFTRARLAVQLIFGGASSTQIMRNVASAVDQEFPTGGGHLGLADPEGGELQTVLENTEKEEPDPLILQLGREFNSLPEASRNSMTWEQILSAIPNMKEFIAGISSLSEPRVYWVNKKGQLVVGDGCAEPAEETMNLDYYESREAAMAVPNRGLITFEEEKGINKGQFDNTKSTWLERGENPSGARSARWIGDEVNLSGEYVEYRYALLGSRRVLRIKLKLDDPYRFFSLLSRSRAKS